MRMERAARYRESVNFNYEEHALLLNQKRVVEMRWETKNIEVSVDSQTAISSIDSYEQ